MERVAGKYELLRKLAAGGMAEVFLAKQVGAEGFEKLVVLKRIHPGRAAEPGFVEMFLDEARNAARLRHPNIVDVYEVLQAQGTWWIAMEWLRGEDVRHVMAAAQVTGLMVPLGIALQIVIDVARGLDHAHRAADLTGTPAGLVHRDISPQNLLVTHDGVTKVVDFGIAKAALRRSEETQEGLVKGKLLYMSPEQARGEDIDHRSDQFSLGVVLCELVTLRRFHARGTEGATLRALLNGQLPKAEQLLPEYPGRAQEILDRVLSVESGARFPSCGVFADALEEFLDDIHVPHSPARVSRLMRELFGVQQAEVARNAEEPPTAVVERPIEGEVRVAPIEERLPSRLGNLPEDADVLFGRDADLERLSRASSEGAQLVTVVGPAGSGKTRLALRHGAQARSAFPGGCWLFSLAEARTAEDVCRVVARELSVAIAPSEDAIVLIGRVLAAKRTALLILDNLEQVADAVAKLLKQWIDAAPSAQFLATSRERLRLPQEIVVGLEPLAIDGSHSPALTLFLHRARSARAEWAPSESDLVAVREIVRRLEGIPLAIELAASRIGVLAPAKLLERLPQGVGLVGGGSASRQTTLRGALDWSWSLLQPWEQSALLQVAVFRGGLDLDAAEAVVDLSGFTDAPWVVDALLALHEKSLLRVTEARPGELRYGLYMVVREYASSRANHEERSAAEKRHAEHFARIGRMMADEVDGLGGQTRLSWLEVEADNLEAARSRSLASGSLETACGSCFAMEPITARRNPRAHLRMLDEVIAHPNEGALSAGDRAKLRLLRARGRRSCGEPEGAIADLSDALRFARSENDRSTVADVLIELGRVEHWRGEVDDATTHFEEALELARAARDLPREGIVSSFLGSILASRDPPRAHAFVTRALALHQESGNRRMEAQSRGTLGYMEKRRGRSEAASDRYREALTIYRQLGDRAQEVDYVFVLGLLLLDRGRLEAARSELDKAFVLAREMGNIRTQGFTRGYQALLEHFEGDLAKAIQAHVETRELFKSTGNAAMARFFGLYRAVALAEAGRASEAESCLAESRAGKLTLFDGALISSLASVALELHARRSTLATAEEALAALALKPDGSDIPPIDGSEDVRFMARLIRRGIEQVSSSSRA